MQTKSTLTRPRPPLRWTIFLILVIPVIVCLTLVPWYGISFGYDAFEWIWFVALVVFCEMSITAGYHRLWSHKAYQAHPVLRVIFAFGGACALQNDCQTWAADHRRHHLYVDDNEKDPYSAGLGFWYSHFGWMIRDYESTREDLSNVKDLLKDPVLVWQRKYYLSLALLMNIGLPILIGYYHGDIWASILLLGFLRLVISQHFTYLINSAAHVWGKRNYDPKQTARDNTFIALLTFGEGYHNYHHTFSWDYRNGIKWYHYDPTKWLIKTCSWLHLTSNLRACSFYRQEKTRLEVQYQAALDKCEQLLHPSKWREQLEHEYQQFVITLNHWAELKELDSAHLKQRYHELQRQLRQQQKNWKALLDSFANSPLQTN